MNKRAGIVLLELILCLLLSAVQAQIPASKDFIMEQNDPYYTRKCISTFTSIPLYIKDNHGQAIIKYLKGTSNNLKSAKADLLLLHNIESPGGRHLTFEQTFMGMPVFNSQLKVNLDKNNRIKSIFDNTWNSETWDEQVVKDGFEKIDLAGITSRFTGQRSLDRDFIKSRKVIALLNGLPVALAEVELWDSKSDEHLLLLADNDLNIFMQRDLNTYKISTTATALVFIPDPLTSAHVEYGDPYVDDSNRDVAALNAERMPVQIEVTFDGSVYRLENEYVVISEFSVPDIPPVTSTTPDFSFTRSQSGFEDVNTFYHITEFSKYVQSIGFDSLVSDPVYADPHALDGKDQSMFSPGFNGLQLYFGEGGVNDAEDADVVVHEFGHALSFSASPGSNNGQERQSVDEGIGDYLATSYSRAIDTFRWADMFTWDGHNEYWNGRTAVTAKTYPDDLASSIHSNGEIYNAALMKIWEDIGKEKTDRILLQSMYGLASNMSMKDAAMLLYDADTALYNGAHFCQIYRALVRRGLSDTFSTNLCRMVDPAIIVDAGSNKTICTGEETNIGNESTNNDDYTYVWSPIEGIGSPFTLVTPAFPATTTFYTLEALYFDGTYNIDSVVVNVLNCNIEVDAGSDAAICTGDTVQIGTATSFQGDLAYKWIMDSSTVSLKDSNITQAFPTTTTDYILKAQMSDGSYNFDTVTVYVLPCDKIQVTNSEGFKYGENLVITFPSGSGTNSIEVFDVTGKRVFNYADLTDQIYTLSGRMLLPGVYILRMKADGEKATKKVVKITGR